MKCLYCGRYVHTETCNGCGAPAPGDVYNLRRVVETPYQNRYLTATSNYASYSTVGTFSFRTDNFPTTIIGTSDW